MSDNSPLPTVDKLTVWSKSGFCPQCTGAKLHIKGKQLDWDDAGAIDIEENAALLADFKSHGLSAAPIIQFPEVRAGDDVIFEARTVSGNRTDVIDEYARSLARVEELSLV